MAETPPNPPRSADPLDSCRFCGRPDHNNPGDYYHYHDCWARDVERRLEVAKEALVCPDCDGKGWRIGAVGGGAPKQPDCPPCNGMGHLALDTNLIRKLEREYEKARYVGD